MPTCFFRIAAAVLLLTAQLAHSQPKSQLRPYTKSLSATTRIETSVDEFVLWVDKTKWIQYKTGTDGVLEFSNLKSGNIGIKVIPESVSVANLRDAVLTNFKNTAPNAKITVEQQRIVNGRQILALQIVATIGGLPVKYLVYCHTGSSGTIQVVGWMVGSAIRDNSEDITEFLNGLEIADDDASGILKVNSAVTVMYDPKKWKEQDCDHPESDVPTSSYSCTFKPSSGDDDEKVGVVVVTSRMVLPVDYWSKQLLSSLGEVADDAKSKILLKKTLRINGVKVSLVKLTLSGDGESYTVFCYFYSGKAGCVMAMSLVEVSLLSKYEKDLMDFLNGLLISE